jgi:hypothetical protein
MLDIPSYLPQFQRVFARNPQLSDIKPSDWAEKNIKIPGKGRLNYDFNPYCRKIIDTLAPDHPAKKISVMKGSQVTFSSGVIMPALGYIIKEDPHNTYLMVGTSDLVKMAVGKLDQMIHLAELQDYISYQVQKKRNTKSGDTDEIKNFLNGYIKTGAATNPKSIAQVDLERIFLDDFDAMKGSSKDAGSFMDLIEMRAAANMNTYKLMMISTPLLKATSNIEPAFKAGNQERYFIDCPCCHTPIIIKFKVSEGEVINPLTGDAAKGDGGIHYEINNHKQLIKSSVGYVCYKCAGYFQDKNKQQMLREAEWMPTAIPISDDYFSFHISSLYAPVGMFDWGYYAGKYIEANPEGMPKDERKMQVLVNTCFGETYEPESKSPQASQIQKNQRDYAIGIIPEALSKRDGNGRIVLVTLESDCNGTVKGINGAREHDARIDYEIVAHSESGATYSIKHGSIGTFVPRERSAGEKEERVKWTYEPGKPNSVWPVLNEIAQQMYHGDLGGRYRINMPGIDVGAYTDFVMPFIDWTIGRYPTNPFVGMRGHKEEEFVMDARNTPLFEVGKARADVYYLQVGLIKDMLSNYMQLGWGKESDPSQPSNFMNYPMSQLYICPVKSKYYKAMGVAYDGDYLYQADSFFAHYESEHRTVVKKPGGGEASRWVKKITTGQNHFFDVRVYGIAKKEIIVRKLGKVLSKDNGIPAGEFSWTDYVNYINS